MNPKHKPLIWLHVEVKSPPFSKAGRVEAGFLLRCLQQGDSLEMPDPRPMPSIGPRCHELRVNDTTGNWRLIYRIDGDAIVVIEVFSKKTRATPGPVIKVCKRRLRELDGA